MFQSKFLLVNTKFSIYNAPAHKDPSKPVAYSGRTGLVYGALGTNSV